MPPTPIDRPLDPAEAFFFLLDKLSGMNFVVFAERAGALSAAQVRQALDAVQADDPLLRARITWNQAGLRFAPADAPLPLQVVDTSAAAWLACIEAELARPFAHEVGPLARCLLLQWPGRCVLALTFHHCIGDGRSGSELLRRVLARVAAGDFDPRPADALPPLHAVLPPQFNWEAQPQTAEQVYAALMADYRRHGKPAPLPWLAPQAAQRTPRVLRLALAADELQRLLAASRAQGATVHGALCAAQLLATQRRLGTVQAAPLFLSCPADLRAHLAPAQPVAPTALLVTMLAASFAVGGATDFWSLAREVTAHTRMQLARGDGHLFFCLYGVDGAVADAAGLARFNKMVMASPHGSCVSNVGRVPAVAADPAVEAISFALCPMPYQTLFTSVTTYADQLLINVAYDAGKQADADAQACVASLGELLRSAGEGARAAPQPVA